MDRLTARLQAMDPVRRAPLVAADHEALRALREEITMTTAPALPTSAEPEASPAARRRLRIGWRGAVGLGLAAALTAGAAYGVLFHPSTVTDGYQCVRTWDTADDPVYSHNLTGDPVADCQTTLASMGEAPLEDPVAFTYDSVIMVAPRSEVPANASLFAPPSDASAVRELEASSRDWVDGMASQCFTAEEGASWAKGELERLGLAGWTVQVLDVQEPQPQGIAIRCAHAWVTPEDHLVLIEPPSPGNPELDDSTTAAQAQLDLELTTLADTLRTGITEQCLSLDDARALADSAIGDLADAPTVSVQDDSAACARVDMEVGGGMNVIVYGPQVASPTP
jgi:hypothetical protein